jgi:hypothetical protein
MAASRIPNPLGQGSSPWGYASSCSIMVIHALGKGEPQVQFLSRAPILFPDCVMVAQQTLTLLA